MKVFLTLTALAVGTVFSFALYEAGWHTTASVIAGAQNFATLLIGAVFFQDEF